MNEKLRNYVDSLFENAPNTVRAVELKEEMLQNLTEKYNDLLAEGKSEEAAYNIAVASIGDVKGLIDRLGEPGAVGSEKSRKRSALFVSIAVGLYILSVVPVILIQDVMGVVIMFACIAVATGLLIYNGITKEKYIKADDTVVEEFKEWKQSNRKNKQAVDAITGSVWLLTVCLYMILSFMTGAWHITWVIFLIAAAISSMIHGIFMLRK